jgi:hypothetical protein
MWVAKVVGQIARGKVRDVVRAGTARRAIQPGEVAHAIGDGVIRACRVSAHPQPTDHLPVRAQSPQNVAANANERNQR